MGRDLIIKFRYLSGGSRKTFIENNNYGQWMGVWICRECKIPYNATTGAIVISMNNRVLRADLRQLSPSSAHLYNQQNMDWVVGTLIANGFVLGNTKLLVINTLWKEMVHKGG